MVDEPAEQPAVAVGQMPDGASHIVADAVRHEVAEASALLVHDPDRGVARVGEFGRRLADPVQRGVQLQSGAHRAHRLQQLRHPRGELGGKPLQAASGPGRRFERILVRAVQGLDVRVARRTLRVWRH